MCRRNTKPVWEQQPPNPVAVGEIVGKEPYILLSEGRKGRARYALWWPQKRGLLHVIDGVKHEESGWVYRREYECDDPACIARTYLKVMNPEFEDEFRLVQAIEPKSG